MKSKKSVLFLTIGLVILIGGAALVIVSLLTPAPEAEILEDFEYSAK
jgi:hypothetical protein